MLPLFVAFGDDGNYAQTAASDLSILQVKFSVQVLLGIRLGGIRLGVVYDPFVLLMLNFRILR